MNCSSSEVVINQVKAKRLDITVFAGDTFHSILFKFWSDIAKTIPIDITANTYVMRIYSGTKTYLIFDVVISGGNILTASTSLINTLNAITYKWDLTQTTPDGDITTYRYGDFRITNNGRV